MNNEETIIMQPQNNKQAQNNNLTMQEHTVDSQKQEEKMSNSGKNFAAVTGAAVVGGIIGGAGTAAAANMFNNEQEEQEPEVKVEEAQAATSTAKPAPKVEEKHETEEVIATVDENGETDYTGNAGADPVAQNPTAGPQPVSNVGNDDYEVQVLGIYENGEGQEMAFLTDGETVAAVLDANGDGVANLIAVDENLNGQFEEGEVHDISDQHISMDQIEQEYLAQQQELMEQEEMEQMEQEHDTFAYDTDDDLDYDNDAPDLSFV